MTCEAFSQKTGAVRNERAAFYEGFSLRSMDHIAVSLAPGRQIFRRARVSRLHPPRAIRSSTLERKTLRSEDVFALL